MTPGYLLDFPMVKKGDLKPFPLCYRTPKPENGGLSLAKKESSDPGEVPCQPSQASQSQHVSPSRNRKTLTNHAHKAKRIYLRYYGGGNMYRREKEKAVK